MRYSEIRAVESKLDEIPDDGNRGGQEPNRAAGVEAGPPYPPEDVDTVKQLQTKLEELGYGVGHTGVDGKYGPRTARAVTAAKKDHNIQGDGNSMNSAQLQKLMAADPVEEPSLTGNEGNHWTSRTGGGAANLDDVEFAQGEGTGRVRMANQGATRNQPLQASLLRILDTAAEAAGVDVVVFSGGQDAQGQGTRRTGSVRHDNGRAADIYIYSDGQRLRTDREDPIVANFIAQAVAAGARGIGAGPGYMGGVGIHVDILGDRAGANYWGDAGRTANTPDYVVAAYRAGSSGAVA